MNRFFKVFLKDPLESRVPIAGFGKHPAWDDHIDDIGLSTDTLVLTKQLLYSEGIATQLASGAWDQIEKSGNAIEFDHRFVWSCDQQSVVGAIWTSADRKGRTRFPLVICAQVGLDGPRAIEFLSEAIERLGTFCRASKMQEEIREAFGSAQAELNGTHLPYLGDHRFSEITDREENLILPELITLSATLKKRLRGPREAAKTSGAHLRLAAILTQTKDNLSFWSTYLSARGSGSNGLPYIVVIPKGKGWSDLIVGEPLQKDFYCLRANEKALPITRTDVEEAQRLKLESEAKDYLQTYKNGTITSSANRRSWWSSLFNK
jgi:hypothetical protein